MCAMFGDITIVDLVTLTLSPLDSCRGHGISTNRFCSEVKVSDKPAEL